MVLGEAKRVSGDGDTTSYYAVHVVRPTSDGNSSAYRPELPPVLTRSAAPEAHPSSGVCRSTLRGHAAYAACSAMWCVFFRPDFHDAS
jgi:hypothetical protein